MSGNNDSNLPAAAASPQPCEDQPFDAQRRVMMFPASKHDLFGLTAEEVAPFTDENGVATLTWIEPLNDPNRPTRIPCQPITDGGEL